MAISAEITSPTDRTDYLNIDDGLVTFDCSMFCRGYLDSVANYYTAVSIANSGDNNDYMRMLVNGAGGLLTQVNTPQGLASFTHATTVSTSEWFSIGMTMEASSLYSYVNGIQSTEDTTAITGFGDAVNRTRIMRYAGSSNSYPWDGDIAEVGVWNAVLTASEMAELDAGASPLSVRPQNLVFYAPLVREIIDVVGGHTITVNGDVVGGAPHPRVIYPTAQILQFPPAAVAGGLSIPVAVYHYNHNIGSN